MGDLRFEDVFLGFGEGEGGGLVKRGVVWILEEMIGCWMMDFLKVEVKVEVKVVELV